MIYGTVEYRNGTRLERQCSSVAYGVVVDVEVEKQMNRREVETSYIATVEPSDKSIFGTSALTSDNTDFVYKKGLHVKIYYDPSDPSTYYIQYAEPVRNDMTLIIIGGVIFVVGVGMLVYYKTKRS